MNTHSFSYSGDAGTSLYSKNRSFTIGDTTSSKLTTDMDHCLISGKQSYAEFCFEVGSTIPKPELEDKDASENTLKSPPRRLSYVRNWRQNITPLKIAPPPPSPFGASGFPTSPVAVISPEQLRVTSLPPYDPRITSKLVGASTSGSSEQCIVNEPTRFHDLYDAELEQMIDDIETSSSSSTLSAIVYIPAAEQSNANRSPRKKFSSLVRWLPTRIKYSLLSSAVKVFHH